MELDSQGSIAALLLTGVRMSRSELELRIPDKNRRVS